MFIPQLDVNETIISHLKDFLFSEYKPSYKQKLSYWERNDYFTSVEVGEIGVLYMPFVFKITKENPSLQENTSKNNFVSLSAFPSERISSKKLFLKWMLRINKYRALEDWQVGYQMLCSQKGANELEFTVKEEFGLWFEKNALFRESYQACFTHKTEVFYHEILQEKTSYSMILTIVLAELWFEFHKGRNQPTFHQAFEIEFTQNTNPVLFPEKMLEILTQEKEIEKELIKKEILNMQEAADFLSLAKQTLYTYTSKQEIPFYKKGKKIHFKRSELEEWLNSGRKATKQEIEKEALKQIVEIRKRRKK